MNLPLERHEAEVAEQEAHFNRLAEKELRQRDEALFLANELRKDIAQDLAPMWVEPLPEGFPF